MASKASRRPTNISLDASLVDDAKILGVNVSRACEAGLVIELKKAREARWLEENSPALESWNQWVRDNGLPGEDIRAWR